MNNSGTAADHRPPPRGPPWTGNGATVTVTNVRGGSVIGGTADVPDGDTEEDNEDTTGAPASCGLLTTVSAVGGVVLRKKKPRVGLGLLSPRGVSVSISGTNGSATELDKERPMSWEGELSDETQEDDDDAAKSMDVMSPSPLPSHVMAMDPGSPMSTNGSDREDGPSPAINHVLVKSSEENGRRLPLIKSMFVHHTRPLVNVSQQPQQQQPCVPSLSSLPLSHPGLTQQPQRTAPSAAVATTTADPLATVVATSATASFFAPNRSPLQPRNCNNQSYSSSSSPEQIRHLFYSPSQSPVQARHSVVPSPTPSQISTNALPGVSPAGPGPVSGVGREPLYSPSQSPVQSRHPAGRESPYSSPYSSVSSPSGSVRYSPTHSPIQGRHLVPAPSTGPSFTLASSGQVDRVAFPSTHQQQHLSDASSGADGGGDSCDGADDRNGLPPELAQHAAALAGQAGISRQQLINSPCPICGDRISGFHYGIFSCESCKGFFKRTVQNKKNYVCLRGANCPVSITTRKKCPACRFDKCLKRGMKLEAIREDRTRGGRSTYQCSYALPSSATHCSDSKGILEGGHGHPLDASRSQDSRSGDESDSMANGGEFSKGRHSHSQPFVPELMQEIMAVEHLWHYSEGELQKMTENYETKPAEADPDFFSNLCNIADHRLYKIVKWCKSLPLFRHIQIDDQICLLLNSWCQLLLLSCCYRSIPTPDEIRVSLGKSVSLRQARSLGLGPIIERMLNLTEHLRRLRVDQYEYICLKVIILLTSDVVGLKEPEKVRHAQEKVIQALQTYTMSHFGEHPSKFGELLLRIPELERTCQIGKDSLSVKHREGEVPSFNLLMELLRGEH